MKGHYYSTISCAKVTLKKICIKVNCFVTLSTSDHLTFFTLQGCMYVPSVIMSCSPVALSTSTRLPGQPSQRPSMRTVCPNIWRDLEHIRYTEKKEDFLSSLNLSEAA